MSEDEDSCYHDAVKQELMALWGNEFRIRINDIYRLINRLMCSEEKTAQFLCFRVNGHLLGDHKDFLRFCDEICGSGDALLYNPDKNEALIKFLRYFKNRPDIISFICDVI